MLQAWKMWAEGAVAREKKKKKEGRGREKRVFTCPNGVSRRNFLLEREEKKKMLFLFPPSFLPPPSIGRSLLRGGGVLLIGSRVEGKKGVAGRPVAGCYLCLLPSLHRGLVVLVVGLRRWERSRPECRLPIPGARGGSGEKRRGI